MKVPIRYWTDEDGRKRWTYLTDAAPPDAKAGFDDLRFFRFDSNLRRSIKRGYSINHANGQREAGLSAYWLENSTLTTRPEIVEAIMQEWNAVGFVEMNGQHLPLWEIEGKIAGYGSDGEPLLTGVKVLGKVPD